MLLRYIRTTHLNVVFLNAHEAIISFIIVLLQFYYSLVLNCNPKLFPRNINEDDAPGVKIEYDCIEKCSNTQIKHWLQCRGLNVRQPYWIEKFKYFVPSLLCNISLAVSKLCCVPKKNMWFSIKYCNCMTGYFDTKENLRQEKKTKWMGRTVQGLQLLVWGQGALCQSIFSDKIFRTDIVSTHIFLVEINSATESNPTITCLSLSNQLW